MQRLVVLALLSIGLLGCPGGDDDDSCPAPPTVTFDNGTCGTDLRFTGEYVDFDNDTHFCGVFDATFTAGAATDTTAPNGRFDLCVPAAGGTVDITPAAALSECTVPQSTYSLGGIAVASPEALKAGMFFSGRNITVARMTSLGVTLDPGKAHVFVHVDQGSRTIAIAAGHDAPQAITDADWAAGDTGHEVFFPNVAAGGTTDVTVSGGCSVGAGSIPLVAGKITNISVLAY